MSKPKSGGKVGRRSSSIWLVVGGAVVAAAVLIAASLQPSRSPEPTPGPGAENLRNEKGPATAKVTVVEYGDYLCPHCADAGRIVEAQLDELIKKGDVRFVFKNFVINREPAQWAAEAAQCAADQGQFWQLHTKLMADQRLWSKETLKTEAGKVKLDMPTFNQCFDSGKYTAQVQQETQEAIAKGFEGTPTFEINGKQLRIQRSFSEVADAVKKELGQK